MTTEKNPPIQSTQSSVISSGGSNSPDDDDLYDDDDDDGPSGSCDRWVASCDGGDDDSDDYDSDGARKDHAGRKNTDSWCHTPQLQHYAKDGAADYKKAAAAPPPRVAEEKAERNGASPSSEVSNKGGEEQQGEGCHFPIVVSTKCSAKQSIVEAHTKEAPPGATSLVLEEALTVSKVAKFVNTHGANLVSWATSSDAAQEDVWVRRLLYEFRDTQLQLTKIFEDNQGAMSMARNPVGHKKLKHVAIRYHFLRELVHRGTVTVEYCPTGKMTADILTKPLGTVLFERHRGHLGVFGL